jgi:hypothetical protein
LNEFFPATTLDWIEYAHDWVQIACYAVGAVIAYRRVRKSPPGLTYQLLAGMFLCFVLALTFVDFYVVIHRTYPDVFSAADVAWIACYFFLLAISLRFYSEFSDEERRAVRRYFPLSLAITAIIVIPFHIGMFAFGGQLFKRICYATGILVTGTFSLQLLFVALKSNVRPQTRNYHIAVIVYLLQDTVMFFAACFYGGWIYYIYYFLVVMQSFMPFVLLRTAKRGWELDV